METDSTLTGRGRPRIGSKGLAASAAIVVLVAALVLSAPLRPRNSPGGTGSMVTIPVGWAAYSAYGLQISVPKSWTVRFFSICPGASRPGSLYIGESTSNVSASCPAILTPTPASGLDLVFLYVVHDSGHSHRGTARRLNIHGILVNQIGQSTVSSTVWMIESKSDSTDQIAISGAGRQALTILSTLSVATRRAQPAPGVVDGEAYSGGVTQTPLSGTIRYLRMYPTGTPRTEPLLAVQASQGHYSATLVPGTYRFNAFAGSAPCGTVSVTVISGRTVTAHPITCNGG